MECERCGECCKQYSAVVTGKIVEAHYGKSEVRVMIKHTCQHLKDDNLCGIYNSSERPMLCKTWYCDKVKAKDKEKL